MMWQSRKVTDLQVDDRVLVHSIVTRPDGDEGEIKIRGLAAPVDDPELRLHYCDAVQSLGWRPVEPYFHLFVVDISDVTSIRYAQTGDQHVARWPAGVECFATHVASGRERDVTAAAAWALDVLADLRR
jgi:hypothetical protein